MLLKGEDCYADLFHCRDNNNNSNSMNHNKNATKSLVLKYEFDRQKVRKYTVGVDIIRRVLEHSTFAKDSVLVTPKYLYRTAIRTVKNCQKAMSIALPLVDDDGNPLEAGKTKHDIEEEVLNGMYKLCKADDSNNDDYGEKNKKQSNNDDDTCDQENQVRDPSWIFQGWFAFRLFGPLAPKAQRLTLITNQAIRMRSFAHASYENDEELNEKAISLGKPKNDREKPKARSNSRSDEHDDTHRDISEKDYVRLTHLQMGESSGSNETCLNAGEGVKKRYVARAYDENNEDLNEKPRADGKPKNDKEKSEARSSSRSDAHDDTHRDMSEKDYMRLTYLQRRESSRFKEIRLNALTLQVNVIQQRLAHAMTMAQMVSPNDINPEHRYWKMVFEAERELESVSKQLAVLSTATSERETK